MLQTLFLVVLFIPLSVSFIPGELKREEVCQRDTFKKISCPKHSFILVRSARYGRYRDSLCYKESHMNCFTNATAFLVKQCSGLETCQVLFLNKELIQNLSCKDRDVVFSLEMEYSCESYHHPDEQACKELTLPYKSSSSNFLLSTYTLQTGKGSPDCPWVFHMTSSQTLYLTIYDFNTPAQTSDLSTNTCTKLAVLKNSHYAIPICSNDHQNTYFKRDKVVSMSLLASNSSRFGVFYQVVECLQFEKPDYVKEVSGNATHLLFMCLREPHNLLHVTCVAGSWTSISESNCSSMQPTTILPTGTNSAIKASQTLLILLVMMIALVISIVIIVVGCYYLRSRSYKNKMEASQMESMHQMAKFSRENMLDLPPQYGSSIYSLPIKDPYYLAKRDYATTLQMRQMAGGYPEMVPCCPAHGPYAGLLNTVDRPYKTLHMPHYHHHREQHQNFHSTPSAQLHHSVEGALNGPSLTPLEDPFYHELDHFTQLPSSITTTTTAVPEFECDENNIKTSNST